MQYFKPVTSAIMMTLGNPKLDSLGVKGNNFTDISARN